MPENPEYPSEEDRERLPDPKRIIDRIINGRLRPLHSDGYSNS